MASIDELMAASGNPNMMGAMPPAAAPDPAQEMGGMPPQQPEIVGPDQVAELKSMFQDAQNKNAQVMGKEIMGRNQISMMRKEVLSKLFQVLQDAGVDPSNPESVRGFLQSLEQQDPDLLEIFMTAFNDLQNGPAEADAPEEQNLMGRFQQLSRMGGEGDMPPMPEQGPMSGPPMPPGMPPVPGQM